MAKLSAIYSMIKHDILGHEEIVHCTNSKGGEMVVRRENGGEWRVMTWKKATADQVAKIEAMLAREASVAPEQAEAAIAKALEGSELSVDSDPRVLIPA